MLSTSPLMALFLVQYTMVTIEALTATLGGNSTPISSSSDLEEQLGDMVIPQEETTRNATHMEAPQTRIVTDYDPLLNDDVGDFTPPSDITAGHVARVAKQAVPSMSDDEVKSIVQALHPMLMGSHW